MNCNFIKINLNLKLFIYIFKKYYILYIFSKYKIIKRKIFKKNIRLILFYNYLYIFSFKKNIINFYYYFFLKIFTYFNVIFKRKLKFIGKGNKFIINSFKNLFISNEFSHNIYLNLNFLNFKLIKYNLIFMYFNNFNLMNKFIIFLEKNIRKKDVYKGKGIFDINKKIILKLGKKSNSF